MNGGFGLFKSNTLQFNVRLMDMVSSGFLDKDIAQKAMDILYGKTAFDETRPVPVPWSEDAKIQAKQYVWVHQFADNPLYKDSEMETPFEKLLEQFNL